MKIHLNIFFGFLLLLGGADLLWAADVTSQQPVNVPAPTPYAATSKSANSSVWERTIYQSTPNGHVVAEKHHFTELATGLHYWSKGQWLDSQELINILPNGTAVAANGQHQVSFPGDIYQGQIEVVTPDGVQMYSRPMGLSYYNGTNNVLIAELTNSIGVVVGSNVVIYPDAFTDFKADLRYTYTKAGIEQDIILKEQPPTPETFGLNSANTALEVLTEFFNTPDPMSATTSAPAQNGLSDHSLAFGQMEMMPGKAFVIGAQASSVMVYKSWQHMEGRTFLLEDVPVPSVAAQLGQLPMPARAGTTVSSADSVLHKVSMTRLLPPIRLVQTGTNTVQLARADVNYKSGVVLDYVEVNTGQTNFTFQGDTTYLVDGSFYLYGTTTIEGGTVIKADVNGQITIDSSGTINCKTAAYRPALFTSVNDDTVGETMGDSSDSHYNGTPGNTPYNGSPSFADVNTFLALNCSNPVLGYMRFSYAKAAITSVANIDIWNSQFVNISNCLTGSGINIGMHNVLIKEVASNYPIHMSSGVFTGENLTCDGFGSGNGLVAGAGSVALTNCLVTSGSSVSVNGGSFTSSPNPIYQTVGAGSYYLTNGSPYRNYGTTNINPTLLAELRQKTTYPPVVYSSTTTSTNLVLNPHAMRDTNASPDLGYHYDPLDYVFSGVEAQSNITFTAGTDVGWYDLTWAAGYGIELDNGATVAFNGTVTAPCWLARYDMSQEGGNGNWTTVGWGFAITSNGGNPSYATNSPQVVSQFTKFSSRNFNDSPFRDYYGFLVIKANNCEFWDAGAGGYEVSDTFSNCFFFRIPPWAYDVVYYGTTGMSFTMVNSTVEGGVLNTFYIQHSGNNWPAIIYNCAFDGTTYTVDTNGLTCDYNAFLTNAARLPIIGAHDVTNFLSYNWQSSWLGDYYLPTSSPVIDKGNTNANLLGLYHFTTQTSQVKETNSVVDIGYHYVATDAYGNPLDSNGDGIPDYLEDANGNGLVDGGETNWGIAILSQPTNLTVLQGSNATFNVTAAGTAPLSYRWLFNGTNLLAGATNASFTITNAQLTNAGNYSVIVTNVQGSITSSVAALSVLPNFTLDFGGTPIVQAAGNDWNTLNNWNPFGLSASGSAASYPGSTYELKVGERLRTPAGNTFNAFPGKRLTIDGGGIYEDSTLNYVAELRLKNGTGLVATNYFTELVLNGGQLDNGGTPGPLGDLQVIQGRITVSSNSTIYVDSGALYDRAFRIEAWLTGSGNLLWHQSGGSLGGTNLQITCATNTFTGQWVVDQGVLLGSGTNSLGTNNIIVGTNGLAAALETLYDIHNTNGNLVVGANGKIFLHQNYVFGGVKLNGTSLAAGVYTFTQLNSTNSSMFPASWSQQNGSSVSSGSGSITVIGTTGSAPTITLQPTNLTVLQGSNATFSVTASGTAPLSYQWFSNSVSLSNGTKFSGVTGSMLTVSNVSVGDLATNYFVIITNAYGSATSSIASLSISTNADSNGDGMADSWEMTYFGTLSVDPNGDPDGDGWSNLQEYQNGTNPNVADQPFIMIVTQPAVSSTVP